MTDAFVVTAPPPDRRGPWEVLAGGDQTDGMFAEQAEYFATLDGPPDEERIAATGARYGVRRIGPGLARARTGEGPS